ncbi:MAG: glycoside hydrolase family 3 N-terminal domain-containing protein [Bacillota bacterium]|nr:glycoside hydrolase family 3 N-terminal domain-containing protein [Bacillota bacterium]
MLKEKNKKLQLVVFLGLILALGSLIFSGCVSTGQTKEGESSTLVTNSSDSQEEIKVLEGEILEGTMNTLRVKDSDNKEYSFLTEGLEIQTGQTGLKIGNPVEISYKGNLDPEAEAQEVEILSIEVSDLVDSNSADSQEETKVLEGEILEGTMNTLRVKDSDNKEYSFLTEGLEIQTDQTGLKIGNPVKISYKGNLDPEAEAQEVEILSIEVSDLVDSSRQKAENILAKMTLEEKVGQMFIGRSPQGSGLEEIKEYKLAGYILFSRDFENKSKDQVIAKNQAYQEAAQIPMFIGVDEEGGTVNRVSRNKNLRPQPFQSPQDLYKQGGFDLIRQDSKEKSDLLKSLGINLNFAPVADLSQDPKDFIYKRSFGQDHEQTAQYVKEVVTVMKDQGLASVLKHFPGYGNNLDTHGQVAYDKRPYENFEQADFIPFKAGIDAGANMVLVAHNVVEAMDQDNPASLSKNVHQILRQDLDFSGLIITDDLAMEGVKAFGDKGEIAVKAVLAGNDLLCSSDFQIQIPAVIEKVLSGDIDEDIIDQAVLRILEEKIDLGLIK